MCIWERFPRGLFKTSCELFCANTRPTGMNDMFGIETQPPWGCILGGRPPRVARCSQPWALRRNPVGIPGPMHAGTAFSRMPCSKMSKLQGGVRKSAAFRLGIRRRIAGFANASASLSRRLRKPRPRSCACEGAVIFLEAGQRRSAGAPLRQSSQDCIKLSDFSLSSIGWRRGLGRGGPCLLSFPLLSPPPLVPRRERMGA